MGWSRISEGMALMAVALAPLVALLASKGMTPLFILIALMGLWVAFREGTWARVPRVPVALIGAILAWGLVSTLWALDPAQTASTSLRLLGGCVGGILVLMAASTLPPERPRHLLAVYATVLLTTTAVIFADYMSGNAVSGFLFRLTHGVELGPGYKSRLNHGATVVALMLWPLAVLVLRERGPWLAAAVLVAVTAALLTGDSLSTKLALLAGGAVFVGVGLAPRWALRLLRFAVVGLMVVIPLGVSQLPPPQKTFEEWRFVPTSAHHRMTIWSFTAEMAAKKPIFGWGLDGSRVIPGADDTITVKRYDGDVLTGMLIETKLPLHPHNAVLQWWLELGAVGSLLVGAFLWVLLRQIERLEVPSWERAACAATFTAAFAVALVSYGFWQHWWQASMWLAAMLCAIVVGKARSPQATDPH